MREDVDVVGWCTKEGVKYPLVSISGTPDGLQQLRETFEEAIERCTKVRCRLGRSETSPPISSDERFLSFLEIRITDYWVIISVEGATVVFSGSPELLHYVPSNIGALYGPPDLPPNLPADLLRDPRMDLRRDLLSKLPRSDHLHMEYWANHPFLASESMPMVIYVEGR